MSKDPYDELGKQLGRAIGRRRGSRLPHRSGFLVALLAVTAGGGAVAAAAGVLSSSPDHDARVRAALNAGYEQTRTDPKCRLLPREKTPRLVEGAVPATLAAELGVFRRAQSQRERDARKGLMIGGQFVLADSIREVRTPDGTKFRLFLSRGGFPGFTPIDNLGCMNLRRNASLAASAPDIKDDVLVIADRDIQRARRDARRNPLYLSFVVVADRYGRSGGGGAGPLTAAGGAPKTGSVGVGRRGNRKFVSLTGLVRDGVTSVRVRDRDPRGDGARTPPVRVRVRGNIYAAELPRGMGPRLTVEWLDARDHVVETTHPRY